MKIEDIARICHNANKALCEAYGDNSQVEFNNAKDWQKQSAIKGVDFVRNNPNAGPDATHNSWLAEKERDGWKFGPIKNPEIKEHPCIKPYDELPIEQKIKDHVFATIVRGLLPFLNENGAYDPSKHQTSAEKVEAATTYTDGGKRTADLSKLKSNPL